MPKQLRAEWVDVMALDPELSPLAFKVACVIGAHFNGRSGQAFLRRETIVQHVTVGLSAVKRAIAELEARGYIAVGRRELGARKSDGQRVYGGRGISNTYRPALDQAPLCATTRGERLAARAEQLREEGCSRSAERGKRSAGEPHSQKKGSASGPHCEPECGPFDDRKGSASGPPTLNLPSEGNPTRARDATAAAARLGGIGDRLRKRLGKADFAAWFRDVEIGEIGDGVAHLVARSAFFRDRIDAAFGAALLACIRAEHPTVQRIEWRVTR